VAAVTVAGALDELTQVHPALRKHLFTSEGKVRAFVNLYLNEEDVRYLPAKEATAISANDTLSIIPSIAGGGPVAEARATMAPSIELNIIRRAALSRTETGK